MEALWWRVLEYRWAIATSPTALRPVLHIEKLSTAVHLAWHRFRFVARGGASKASCGNQVVVQVGSSGASSGKRDMEQPKLFNRRH